ncbi:nucleotidyltransferase family protein [Candidatus Nitrosocosmicus franklandus]|nr:nucleotidyltransferase family protein [Candidatus Nitrosocosmicus franklandus]
MKAVIPAGGLGTRGKPFTDYCPKAMIPIDGRPIIDHVIRYICKFSSISEIIIVCEFDSFGKQIINYFEGKENLIGKKIRFIEDKKGGTGGALLQCQDLLRNESCFLIWYTDNLCAIDLDDMYKKFEFLGIGMQENHALGMIVTRSRRYEETGRVLIKRRNTDNIYTIQSFIEKPVINLEYPEALGIYLFSQKIFDVLLQYVNSNTSQSFDLSADILAATRPDLQSMLYSYDIDNSQKEWIDVESPTSIYRNAKRIKTILKQMNAVRDQAMMD